MSQEKLSASVGCAPQEHSCAHLGRRQPSTPCSGLKGPRAAVVGGPVDTLSRQAVS